MSDLVKFVVLAVVTLVTVALVLVFVSKTKKVKYLRARRRYKKAIFQYQNNEIDRDQLEEVAFEFRTAREAMKGKEVKSG